MPTTPSKRYSFSVPLEGRELWQRTGFVVHSVVPVARPGAYRFRAAVRDRASGRTGTAEQFIEIPDLSRHRAALLGLAGADDARRALPAFAVLDPGFSARSSATCRRGRPWRRLPA